MKGNLLMFAAGLLALLPCAVVAQVVPTTPTKFNTKPVGAATSTNGTTINPPATVTSIRQVTYLTLTPLRQWNSTEGKSLMGKLIAWEETVTTTRGTATPATESAAITTKPTVVRNNKARLLIETKAVEVPLDRLAAEERQFIQDLQSAIARKP